MELRNIKSFIKVAEFENFSKAAEVLGYAQSTITLQIQQLE
ncbi:MAG: LysR family transcriptional regulator, partial [Lachnospiraceae bacterium]|nr:LysR family transcriptional regulator [Lachnospira sp.]MBS1471727.1 LysR family transcriptional regulator [Lachnospiraceae bacterium]